MSDCDNATCQDSSNVKNTANDLSLTDRSSTTQKPGKINPETAELYEPKTPLWFTLLGVGLLLSAVITAIAMNAHERTLQGEQMEQVDPIPEKESLEPTGGVSGELQKNVNNE